MALLKTTYILDGGKYQAQKLSLCTEANEILEETNL